MMRMSAGQVASRSPPGGCRMIPVRSATCAAGSRSPSVSTAAPQSLLRSCSIPATVRSSTGQPMVYSTRRPRLPCSGAVFNEVRWSMTSWEAPAPSTGDQHVGAPPGGDLGERRGQHRQVIDGGKRTGVARAPHHRQRVPDVGPPAGQRVKAEPALVVTRRLGLGAGCLDQGGVQPDDQHRARAPAGLGGRSG